MPKSHVGLLSNTRAIKDGFLLTFDRSFFKTR
jgi:hypothetical protein